MSEVKGGDKLQAYLYELAQKVKDGKSLKVGFLEGATEPDGTSIPMIAAIQEFGAPGVGIPPRPFFRNMVAKEQGHWGDDLAADLKATDYNAQISLARMGELIKGELQQSIIDTNAPPLSQVTLMLRKMRSKTPGLVVTGATVGEAAARVKAGESTAGVSTKPLVDSGNLLNSVDYEVTS